VREVLEREPQLVDAWHNYSYDKRSTPSLYLDGTEVGFYDTEPGRSDVNTYDDALAACAEFICREAAWVLHRTRRWTNRA
jgi:hypothetical protein